ncbi:hypothetical protein ACFX11_021831 [Malus domestica]
MAGVAGAGTASTSTPSSPEEKITLTVKWSGKEHTVKVYSDDTVGELKRTSANSPPSCPNVKSICQLTTVTRDDNEEVHQRLVDRSPIYGANSSSSYIQKQIERKNGEL